MLGSGHTEKGDTGEEQSKKGLKIFFESKGIVHR
jgi:hypothetical protein